MSLSDSALRKLGNGSLRILPFDEIDNKVRLGEYQFHRFGGCWVWTQVTEYQSERVLDVVLLLGEGLEERKAEMVEKLAAFAREHGCSAIEALSRRGLQSVLRPLGFKPKRVLLRKDV